MVVAVEIVLALILIVYLSVAIDLAISVLRKYHAEGGSLTLPTIFVTLVLTSLWPFIKAK